MLYLPTMQANIADPYGFSKEKQFKMQKSRKNQ